MTCPTIDGRIVEDLDQVFITTSSVLLFLSKKFIFFNRCAAMKGPFFNYSDTSSERRPINLFVE